MFGSIHLRHLFVTISVILVNTLSRDRIVVYCIGINNSHNEFELCLLYNLYINNSLISLEINVT